MVSTPTNIGYSLFQALPAELVYEINLMARDVYGDERKRLMRSVRQMKRLKCWKSNPVLGEWFDEKAFWVGVAMNEPIGAEEEKVAEVWRAEVADRQRREEEEYDWAELEREAAEWEEEFDAEEEEFARLMTEFNEEEEKLAMLMAQVEMIMNE